MRFHKSITKPPRAAGGETLDAIAHVMDIARC
jgi:hypothetical protein